jgi:hypothetical protein
MDKVRFPVGSILYLACLIDVTLAIMNHRISYINAFCKPIVVLLFLPTIRQNLRTVAYDLYASLTILLFIMAFVFFFAFAGYFLFLGTLEGD